MTSILRRIGRGKNSWEPEGWLVVNDKGKSFIKTVFSHLHLQNGGGMRFILFGDQPFAAMDQVCPTCSGILYSGYSDKSLINEWLINIRNDTQDVTNITDSTLTHFYPIIELLEPGLYYLGVINHKTTDKNVGFFMDMFGKRIEPYGLPWRNEEFGPHYLYPTQSTDKIDDSTVMKYRDMVDSGKRPFGIAYYYDGFLSLLLDGHHKAKAYHQLNMDIPCLTIQRKQPYQDDNGIFYEFGNGLVANINEIPKEVALVDRLPYEYYVSYERFRLNNKLAIDFCKKLNIRTPLQELGLTPIQAIEQAMELKKENKNWIDLFNYGLQELTDREYAKRIGDELFKEKWGKWQASKLYAIAGDVEGLRRYADSLPTSFQDPENAYKCYLDSGLTESEISKRSRAMAKYIPIRNEVLRPVQDEYDKGRISEVEFDLKKKETIFRYLEKHWDVLETD